MNTPYVTVTHSNRGNGDGRRTSALQTVQPHTEVAASSFEPQLARALGWFSIGLGLTELLMPRQLGKAIGLGEGNGLLPLLGLREIATGIAILSMPDPTNAVLSRVAGDVMDLALLGRAVSKPSSDRTRVAAAAAAVLSVTALDILCSVKLARSTDTAMLRSIRVSKSLAINRPPEELYRFWRQLDNLPQVMSHLRSVQPLEGARSHWDAEITDELLNQRLAWRSLKGSEVPNQGSVTFTRLSANHGTMVCVDLLYSPPGGRFSAAIAELLGQTPEQQISTDLRRFKQRMETGEVATTEGQPSGRRSIISRNMP